MRWGITTLGYFLGALGGCGGGSEPAGGGGTTSSGSTTAPPTADSEDASSSSTTEQDPDGSSSSSSPPGGGSGSSSTDGATSSTTGVVEHEFLAGFDVADISPNEGHLALNVYLGSYGPPFSRSAEGLHDALHVRSFALQYGGEGFVAAITDLPGMGNEFSRAIQARVSEQLEIPVSHVLVGTTHSHSAPDFQGLWGGGPSEYRNPVVDEIVGSMNRAWAERDFAELEIASTIGPNANRRDWGFTDDSLTVLVARDEAGGIMGSFTVFGAHPTVLGSSNHEVSRDWCGGFVDAMEAHTSAPSVLFNGVLGDARPVIPPGEYADDFERAIAYGNEIADIAFEAISEVEPISGGLYIDHRTWDLPVDNGLFQLAAGVGLLDYDFGENDDGLFVTTGATYVRLGTQFQFVTFPGEPLTRTGLEIKDAMDAPHRAILGQTGDSLGYFILSDEWMTGHNDDYEETVSLHPTAGDTATSVLTALIEVDDFD